MTERHLVIRIVQYDNTPAYVHRIPLKDLPPNMNASIPLRVVVTIEEGITNLVDVQLPTFPDLYEGKRIK